MAKTKATKATKASKASKASKPRGQRPSEAIAENRRKAAERKAEKAGSVQERMDEMVVDIKETLEFQLADKVATVMVQGKVLQIKKWGMRKKLTLGSRVTQLINKVSSLAPAANIIQDASLMGDIMGIVGDDIMMIVAQSIVSPFETPAKAMDWLDDECGFDDIINLGFLIYDMNLKETEELGKLTQGLEKVTEKVHALISPK